MMDIVTALNFDVFNNEDDWIAIREDHRDSGIEDNSEDSGNDDEDLNNRSS